jgi:PAS domain S-box-containing protein
MRVDPGACRRDCGYRSFFDDCQDGMYVSSAEGRFLAANKSLCLMLGYSRDQLLALPVTKVYELPRERRRFVFEIEGSGAVRNFHIRLKGASGTILHCSIDAAVWRQGPKAMGYVGIIRHRSPASGFAESESSLELAMRGSNDGLWEWDVRRRKSFFSPRWKALLGYSISEIGEEMDQWYSRIHPEDLSRFKGALVKYIKRETAVFSCYHRMRRRDGQWIWMMGRGVGDFTDSGSLVRMAGSLTDVSGHLRTVEHLKREETALSIRNERLEKDRELLSRYFPEQMVAQICRRSDEPTKGSISHAAVISLKIRDSLDLMNTLGPERFADFLNDFTTDVLDLTHSNKGAVNRVLGDSILITFGCPVSSGDDLADCVSCAFDIVQHVRVFNDVRPDYMISPLEVSMGLAFGTVFSGSIGSIRRMEYTILGVAVSRAQAIMEAGAKLGEEVVSSAEIPLLLEGRLRARETPVKGLFALDPSESLAARPN